MANITLQALSHRYSSDAEWALRDIDMQCADGGAYALLGPSGCGKSTLLNIISGLINPSEGSVLFDGREVNQLSPEQRNIAQVFQFPVVYDTISVYDNLAFPLRNRGVSPQQIKRKVHEIAELLELSDQLQRKAANLGADSKQKISMGRGLVREDVNVIMFDEPLTVIDPHLKWQLRSKLKELHQRIGVTMIYVTHDQTEALTFADEVVVMQEGEVVQIGSPVELFEKPGHVFVGHFIGSPGMNNLPLRVATDSAYFGEHQVASANSLAQRQGDANLSLGIRPEYVQLVDEGGMAARVVQVLDAGKHQIVECHCQGHSVKALLSERQSLPEAQVYLRFQPDKTWIYQNDYLL